jgi:hypothetical protein
MIASARSQNMCDLETIESFFAIQNGVQQPPLLIARFELPYFMDGFALLLNART